MTAPLQRAWRTLALNIRLLPERWHSGVAYNPLAAAMARDPYPVYAKLRRRSPTHHSRLMDALVLSRYADVDAVLRDHARFSNDPDNRRPGKIAAMPIPDQRSILFMDPPDHTRLRGLINKAFTRAAINALEPRIRALMGALLDAIDDPSGFDLMDAVAGPLPIMVIAEMLGVPQEDRAQFRRWSDQRARLLEPTLTPAERQAAVATSEELDAYFLPLIRRRRAEPRDDIISGLAQAEERGDTLTETEMLLLLRLLLVAGTETTTNLIGNGVLALLRHPNQLQALREDPNLILGAVDELLRYDSPVQMDLRSAREDCALNGAALRRGQDVLLLLGSANRDPEVFADPDRLDFSRPKQDHIAFGRGIHYCLGAALARLEGRVAVEMLLERFASLRLLTSRPTFRNSVVLRGLQTLPLGARPRRAGAGRKPGV